MKVDWPHVGEVLVADREAVEPEPGQLYSHVGVRGFGRGLIDYPQVPALQLPKLRFFALSPDRLVISNIKGWEGAVALTSAEEEGRIASSRFLQYKVTGADVSLEYVRHWLLSDAGLRLLGDASPGSADRNRTLSRSAFESGRIPLPSPSDRRRVVAHLRAVEERSRNAGIQVHAQRDGLSASELPRLTGHLLRQISRVRVRDVATTVNDTVHPGDDLRSADVFVGLEHVESHTGVMKGGRPVLDETGRKFRFEAGDVTYGYLRPYLNKVWAADRVGLCSVEQFVLRPRDGVRSELLAACLRTDTMLNAAIEATNSLQLPRLKLESLMASWIPDPREITTDTHATLDRLQEQVTRLGALRERQRALVDGILPAARNEIFGAMR